MIMNSNHRSRYHDHRYQRALSLTSAAVKIKPDVL